MHKTDRNGQLRKIKFTLHPNEDGWPPSDYELLWARQLEAGKYQIDNLPFYVHGVAYLDIVEAEPEIPRSNDAIAVFRRVLIRSGHSLYRIFLLEPSDERWDAWRRKLLTLGCGIEGADMRLFAVDVPPTTDIQAAYRVLASGAECKYWDFEEAYYYSQK